jgi:NADH dehydrogenase, FAD-containing subunit
MADRTQNTGGAAAKRLVLVGAGHAHLHVLREWARRPMSNVELVLVSPHVEQWYSGMIPGFVAGRYERDELRVDLGALARCAGARLLAAPADGVSAAERVVTAAGEVVRFDLCSIDVGAAMAGAEIPGVREHAVPLRPAERAIELRDRIDTFLARSGPPLAVVVVGAGTWGVEAAFALRERMHGSARADRSRSWMGRGNRWPTRRRKCAGEPPPCCASVGSAWCWEAR